MIGLLNSTLVLFLPVCGIWMLLGAAKDRRPFSSALSKAVMAGTLFFACLAPWMLRNWTVFHAFVPIRGNLGAELHASVREGYNGFTIGIADTRSAKYAPISQEYKQMGELAYVRREGRLAQEYIRVAQTALRSSSAVKRFYFYWVSVPKPPDKFGAWNEAFRVLNYSFLSLAALLGLALALKRRIPGAVFFAWAFAVLPLVYYFVTVQARFRHPLEPIMTILAVFLFQSATPRRISSASTAQ